ncbi:MAG: hypothetical protein OQK98_00895 [Gammaproteobacteria bacterium]|nr:hypothetical protein [Gammaproteobacteria bacterium]
MGYKSEVIDRLHILQKEINASNQEFKKILSNVTTKHPRTIRRWYSLEANIQEADLKKIALHFGHHENWLKWGNNTNSPSLIDEIMTSNHYGAVIMKEGAAEKMNHKFIQMMNLTSDKMNAQEACHYVLSLQSEETVGLCEISGQIAIKTGSHHHSMNMIMGDEKKHSVDVTTLNINNGRVLRIISDKGMAP